MRNDRAYYAATSSRSDVQVCVYVSRTRAGVMPASSRDSSRIPRHGETLVRTRDKLEEALVVPHGDLPAGWLNTILQFLTAQLPGVPLPVAKLFREKLNLLLEKSAFSSSPSPPPPHRLIETLRLLNHRRDKIIVRLNAPFRQQCASQSKLSLCYLVK